MENLCWDVEVFGDFEEDVLVGKLGAELILSSLNQRLFK